MKSACAKIFCFSLFAVILVHLSVTSQASAKWPKYQSYVPELNEIEKHKAIWDDPRPALNTFGPKQVIPEEMYDKMTYDVEKMKSLWEELVGFKSTDAVGKIAPEIKPGKYTYKDLEKYPGFKELMPPELYKRIKPGAPPLCGNIPEFEVVPTRQYYWALPVAQATRQNLGKTQLDDQGYLVQGTWKGGIPFPKPSGTFKAQQIMQNLEKRYMNYNNNQWQVAFGYGYDRNLENDYKTIYSVLGQSLSGRVDDPAGFFDQRAEGVGEYRKTILHLHAPRDIAGSAYTQLFYLDPKKNDQVMMYISSIRRVRKLSSSDTQDPQSGSDVPYDDNEGFMQRLSPTRFPYSFKIIAEREFLLPAVCYDGSEYIDSKTKAHMNLKFERRPLYVVELTQQDPNYVYSKRIFYIDKETFLHYSVLNYDQKGRLYRTWDHNLTFFPEMGAWAQCFNLVLVRDHVDHHTTTYQPYTLPVFTTRADMRLMGGAGMK